ncbi:MarR family transcriptional regulator [Janibacter melonis]|uniref:MarR family transcriptional regulator n=2 Tax=Janibacter melonis TaxID=262209 RepID=A0A5P8FQD6_9MICO|nr:MarR family transcriptional regulator [Janibacter melonis]QFQ31578.1 MarR family transcriptional regulator [Janibacter melonis]
MRSAHCHVDHALSTAVAQVGLSLVEFTVLDILEEQVDAHLRMQDVACVAALTTGATTRLVGRLESRGLLRRVICASDRRGIYTELTDDGRDLLAAARPVHDAALRACLEDPATVAAVSSAAAAISRR